MTTVELLRAARELIATPDRWCKGSFARDAQGSAVAYLSPSACRFCAFGAVRRAVGLPATGYTIDADSALIACLPPDALGDLPTWQDARWRGHAEVLALYDRAIAAEEDASRERQFARPLRAGPTPPPT